jgi:hypothetical protein
MNDPKVANKKSHSSSPYRKFSLAAGLFYLITFVSIPTIVLYGPIHSASYIVGSGPDTNVFIGAILEVIVALANIGTAVALFPVVKKQNEGVALGFVGARTLESAAIFVGVACLLSITALRQAGVGAGGVVVGQALAAMYDRTFMLGQSVMPAINALLLGTLLYKSRLVPRILPIMGLIGAPLLLAAQTAILFGLIGRLSSFAAIGAMPIALWEFSLGLWLTFKGFNAMSPIFNSAKN